MGIYNKQDMFHNFHIPVMGTGFSIDTPVKVAHLGIDSVISLVDDELIEQMREYYSKLFNINFLSICKSDFDYRASRITAYLNLLYNIIDKKFYDMKQLPFDVDNELFLYLRLLPQNSPLKSLYYKWLLKKSSVAQQQKIRKDILSNMRLGEIQVNIMTKIDKANDVDLKDVKNEKGEPYILSEFSDSLSALRGFANSDLSSSIVFSAGISRRLYSYIAKFKDFYADVFGFIKKRIILKISDYRSAAIQGAFLAQKGVWVSEFRFESGINCGGHAFISDGRLMGDILQEMVDKKKYLRDYLHSLFITGLKKKGLLIPKHKLDFRVTAQGGVGSSSEHKFLLDHYQLDSIGWGSPFLLVPEVTAVSNSLLERLQKKKKGDIYLSDASPLGVPFYNLKLTNSELERQEKIAKGVAGSSCPKRFLVSNVEFTDNPICVSSRQYQKNKLDIITHEDNFQQVTKGDVMVKSCLCVGLSDTALEKYNIQTKNRAVTYHSAICPGPNLDYFNKIVGLKTMVDHIYGRNPESLLVDCEGDENKRMHVFFNELILYINYLNQIIFKQKLKGDDKSKINISKFHSNLLKGIQYYRRLFLVFGRRWIKKPDIVSMVAQLQEQYKEILSNLKQL